MLETEDAGALREEIRRLRKSIDSLTPDIPSMLRLRGFKVFASEPADDLFLPDEKFVNGWYEMLLRYSFRLFLRDVIKHQDGFTTDDVTHYSSAEITDDYIKYLLETGMAERHNEMYRLVTRPVKSFGETLEWLVAEVIKREFGTSTIWGIRFKDRPVGGDYDVIAKINGGLLYLEVKSSPPKQIYPSEVSAFLDRAEDLSPEISVFFMDTELRMKDKIVPMFEEVLAERGGLPPEVKRMHKELFRIGDEIFIINVKGGIAANLEKVLSWHFRKRI